MYEVREYETAAGYHPFREWILSLGDRRAVARINSRIARVRLGNLGDHRHVGNGIWELRVHAGPGYRVYFGREGAVIILLLCGGDKSGQERDIEYAKTCWADHLRRRNAL